ncbi:hypothetical protein Ddye_026886 [Dipteronia dyeriana]|uniref:Reverse transcriptase zinc-binding domain-containing protein n=1 Tax=Dipteronia dyeriana TaxID=168575 RepID=A0AAD9WPY9_9ROSI|nr:hypothetical protein Ddye_026886 [Dipteronia dyeriana]
MVAPRGRFTQFFLEVCKSKFSGGLGIGRVLVKNNGMLAKWIWRFGREKDALWRREVRSPFEEGSPTAKIITEGFSTVVGKVDRADFWTKLKWDSRSLREAFPRVFALASKKSGPIQDFGRWMSSAWVWDVQTRRSLFDWEREQWFGFQTSPSGIPILNLSSDALVWNLNRNGLFTVSSFRRNLEGIVEASSSIQKVIWNGICPSKVEVFLWQLYKGKVLVREVLQRFGMGHLIVLDCRLCSHEAETVDHLFPLDLQVVEGVHGMVGCELGKTFLIRLCLDAQFKRLLCGVKKGAEICDQRLGSASDEHFQIQRSVRGNPGQALKLLEGLEVVHASRMFNSFTDNLAKMGSGSNGDFLHWM